MGLFSLTRQRHAVVATLFVVLSLVAGAASAASANYNKGQHVEPAYEGWRQLDDGSYVMMFGYHNENWVEEPDVPVGENNFFSPGEEDRGQPTHFLPKRNRFTFEVPVPADWGDKELEWSLTVNGVTKVAYGTLARDYVVDNVVIASETGSLGAGTSSPESRANIPPTVEVQGDRVGGEVIRTVRVGETLTLTSKLEDDGLPQPRSLAPFAGNGTAAKSRLLRPPVQITVGKINGLFLAWNVYRGEGNVTFDPPQSKPWEDTRTSANSPWGAHWTPPEIPEDGMIDVNVTFDKPGTYILWARADDGGLYHDEYVTVNVLP